MKNGDTKSVSDALKMFGDQNSAAKWFGHLNTKSDGSSIISDGIMEMFIKAFDTIDADAVKKNIAKGAKAESSSIGDMAQIWSLHLLAYTSLTASKTEAYFSCTFDLSNSI